MWDSDLGDNGKNITGTFDRSGMLLEFLLLEYSIKFPEFDSVDMVVLGLLENTEVLRSKRGMLYAVYS